MEKKVHYRILFYKYIHDTLDEAELELLASIIESEEYESEREACFKEYFQLSEEEEPDQALLDKSLPIVDETWKQLTLKLNEENHVLRIPQNKFQKYFKYVAAIVLLLTIGSVWYYMLNKGKERQEVQIVAEEILPGSNRATLSFEGEKSITLSEAQTGLIVSEEGMSYSDGTSLVKSDAVKIARVSTPRSGQYQVKLADGTKVWLNSASSIEYPTQFVGPSRRVKVSGEAYLEVSKNPEQPFIVETGRQEIKVLGTSFNVNTYGDKGRYLTTLVEGSLEVSSTKSQEKVLIKPGQQAILSSEGSLKTQEVDIDEYASWKDGIYVINNLTLEEFGNQIERWYDVEVDMGKFKDRKLSATIRRDVKLNEVLEAIELNTKIKFSVKDRRVSAYQ